MKHGHGQRHTQLHEAKQCNPDALEPHCNEEDGLLGELTKQAVWKGRQLTMSGD